MPILECKNLRYVYSQGTPFEHLAIDGVNFDIEENQIIGIIGHTGSGKSTLIQHFNALLQPTEGQLVLNGKDVWAKENKKDLRSVRFEVGLCFQYPEHQIFEETIFDEIAFGPKQMGLNDEEIKSRVYSAMQTVQLSKDMENVSPFDLSGGQKRRVAIASIIAMNPKILVLDEPCAGLDPAGRDNVLELIKTYQKQSRNTVVFVSHSMEDIAKICDKVLVMNDSKAFMCGTVEEVFCHSEELQQIGLNIPEITQVFLKLKDMGIDCNTNIYTIEQGIAEYNRLLKQKEAI